MALLSIRGIVGLSTLILVFSLPAAKLTQHPDFPDRLVQTRDSLTVEYAPDQEPLVDAVFLELEKWREEALRNESAIILERAFLEPFSYHDMKINRDELLTDVANAIGLSKPTQLQKRTYDTFLGYYEMSEEFYLEAARMLELNLKTLDYVTIWQDARLNEQLKNGAKIPGFGYNQETESATSFWTFSNHNSKGDRFDEIRNKIASYRLKHTFNRRPDGIRASVSTGKRPANKITDKPATADNQSIDSTKFRYPLVLTAENLADSPQKVAHRLTDAIRWSPAYFISKELPRYDPALVFLILHETVEAGLVDRYITSPDRRWVCDGTANYVAWEIIRDWADVALADTLYDIDRQLSIYKELQERINLASWPATENPKSGMIDPELERAHYAYATRAIFNFAEEYGTNSVAKLWKAIGDTPKQKTSMKTVSRAYQKLTHQKLSKLINKAESDPIH